MLGSTLRILFGVLVCCTAGLTAAFGQAAQNAAPDGLAGEDWAGIRAAHEEIRHAAYAVKGGGYQAHNPGQQWLASFDGRGFSVLPDAGGWTWGLQLERYGFAGSEEVVTKPARMSAEGGHVIYEWNETLEEWYVNDTRGLEQGFTVASRPVADEQGSANPLIFTFAVRGPLRPKLDADGRGVRFLGERGAIVLTYTGLLVVDADGRELEASFECVDDKILLSVDELGARYPLTIDPIVQQQAYIKAHNTGQGDSFGQSVSMSANTVVVGAPGQDGSASQFAPNSGAAYVFVKDGSTWTQQAYLTPRNSGRFDFFGAAVSVSGDTVVVGAPFEDSKAIGVNGIGSDNSAPKAGAAYVFVRNGTTWRQQAYIKASNTDPGDEFGVGVSVSGDTIVVGANMEDGGDVGVNGDDTDNGAPDSGAAYVFVRSGSIWSQQAYLKASNAEAGDFFGGIGGVSFHQGCVSVFGDTVLVGAPREDSIAAGVNGNEGDNSSSNSGAAYVFVRNGSNWSQQAYLKASNASANDWFGSSVSMAVDTLVVGAPLSAGAAYVFKRSGSLWSQQAHLTASAPGAHPQDHFGASVSVFGDSVVVGVPYENSGATQAGAAYLFARNGVIWNQVDFLKASNVDAFDAFGFAVSASEVGILIGAFAERSSATGVNGDQGDNSAFQSGAAYIFGTPLPDRYCTGKTTSAVCVPFLAFSGTPSAGSGAFDILSRDHIEGEPAIYLYSAMKANLNFHGGKLCVKTPFHRLTTLINATDGLACTGCPGNCRMFKRDFNQLIQAGTDPMLTPGQDVRVQVRQNDPANLGPTGFGDNLSDALAFTIAP